jgi:hypothetical protein
MNLYIILLIIDVTLFFVSLSMLFYYGYNLLKYLQGAK